MKKVCIIGHFAFNKQMLDGQTIKTLNIYKALINELGKDNVSCIDTHGGKRLLPMLFFQSVVAAFKHKNIIMLPAHNGIKFFAPLLALLSKVTSCKMHYVVIGGWLCSFLKEHHWLINKLKCFSGIYVETSSMKVNLEATGFTNVFVVPNFKFLHILKPEELVYQYEEPFKLCTFSRVMKEKGIEDAIDAVKSINQKFGKIVYQLDIYGQIEEQQLDWFRYLENKFGKEINYKGVVPFDESVNILKDYYMLVFPTLFYTEGIPGTIIDGYASGVPVLSSKWESFDDVVIENNTGIGYEIANKQDLKDKLIKCADSVYLLNSMKEKCLERAVCYSSEYALRLLFDNLA